MSGFVDIHSHVLPGIDDGPSDLAGALAMARAAAHAGTATLVATPHLRYDFPGVRVRELAGRCESLSVAIEREGIPIEVLSGAEVSLVWALEASDEELALASYGQRGSDLLIETPMGSVVGLDRILMELRLKGYRLTLAHPERNADFQRDGARLRALVDQGVLLQINADSLVGPERDPGLGRLARRLCGEGLAHVLASDGHRSESWRPVTELERAVRAAAMLVGAERAEWMAHAAPAAIIEGAGMPDPPAIVPPPRRGWLFGRR